ncbi:AP-5 complex subunit sigma-1 [Dromaius novaehollandiae]|uniref:AP-5 complex subunit sigma-1 n=1 Tax=Dromaius novaehollandiae TaxID=8790 RepID=UPI00311D3DD4
MAAGRGCLRPLRRAPRDGRRAGVAVAMVRAFVLHTLGGPAPPAAAPGPAAAPPPRCRVLYARAYEAPGEGAPARQRLRRKEQLLAVARQVTSQCRLLQAAAGRAASLAPPQLPDEPVSLQAAPGGLFRLRPGDPFSGPATVVWLAVLALGFALVCEPHENLLLAESTLRRLARRLLGALRLLGPGAEALLRAGHAEALLDRLLPHGQLLFLGEAAAQALEREAPAKALR